MNNFDLLVTTLYLENTCYVPYLALPNKRLLLLHVLSCYFWINSGNIHIHVMQCRPVKNAKAAVYDILNSPLCWDVTEHFSITASDLFPRKCPLLISGLGLLVLGKLDSCGNMPS